MSFTYTAPDDGRYLIIKKQSHLDAFNIGYDSFFTGLLGPRPFDCKLFVNVPSIKERGLYWRVTAMLFVKTAGYYEKLANGDIVCLQDATHFQYFRAGRSEARRVGRPRVTDAPRRDRLKVIEGGLDVLYKRPVGPRPL